MNADLKNSSSLSQGPIHLVTDQFNIGGGIEHIYQIAAGMKNFKFRIFALPGKGDALEKFNGLDNVEIHGNGFKPDQLLEGNPRLIHFHHLRPLLSFFKTPFTRSPVPMVFTAHGLHIHKYEFTHNIRARVNYILRFHLEKRLFAKVDRVIAVSREDKAFIETNYKVNNVLYLTNGIDFKGADSGPVPSKQKLRRELDLPRDEFLFVTVARFNFQKGYDILIKGIAKAIDSIREKKCRFVFVGDGEEMAEMKELSTHLSVGDRITFLGARNDVYDILRAGDVCLLSSRWEGLPIVLIEAGLLKIPVVASNTYGNREIIKENCGHLFKNLDSKALAAAISDTLDNRFDLSSFANRLHKEVVENYNLEKMLSGLRNIYNDVS